MVRHAIYSRVPENVKRFARPILRFRQNYWNKSYSQSGEDLILSLAFYSLGISRPTYLDIGAHHPEYLSNTALFYQRGCSGVNVEPDPRLYALIRRKRRRDVNLNIGISDREDSLAFYVMSSPELSTFRRDEAERLEGHDNLRIVRTETVRVEPINKVLEVYFAKSPPDLLSIDTEGMDSTILRSLDFAKHAPLALCVETINYTVNGTGTRNQEIIEYLQANGYLVYADTFINTIFFSKKRFEQLKVRSA